MPTALAVDARATPPRFARHVTDRVPVAAVTVALAAFGALVLAVTTPLRFRDAVPTSYSALTTAAIAFLLVAGLWGHARLPRNRTGLLLYASSVMLMAEDFQLATVPWVHQGGIVLAQMSMPFLAHAALAFPTGRLAGPRRRWTVGAAYAWCLAVGVAFLIVLRGGLWAADTGRDTGVWRTAYAAVEQANLVVGGGLMAVTLLLVWQGTRTSPPAVRTQVRAMAIGVTVVIATSIAAIIAVTLRAGGIRYVVVDAYSVSLVLLGLIFLSRVIGVNRGLVTVQRLSDELAAGPADEAAEARLRELLGDEGLRVVTRRRPSPGFVTRDGEAVTVDATVRRRVIRVGEASYDVALVSPSGAWSDPRVAAALLDLVALHLARRWSAEAAHALLSRDVHDGPQQRLVAVALRLRLAEDAGTDVTPAFLAGIREEIERSVGELRQLARGPGTALDATGLLALLQAVADGCPVPLRLETRLSPSPSPSVATCAGYVVREGVTNALRHAEPTWITVRVLSTGPGPGRRGPAGLDVHVEDDGVGGARTVDGGGLDGLRHRVERLGGTLRVTRSATGGTVLTAHLPPVPS